MAITRIRLAVNAQSSATSPVHAYIAGGLRERPVRERERECVCERERERERVCVCVCERERERVCV